MVANPQGISRVSATITAESHKASKGGTPLWGELLCWQCLCPFPIPGPLLQALPPQAEDGLTSFKYSSNAPP